jgi:hypothetical protein
LPSVDGGGIVKLPMTAPTRGVLMKRRQIESIRGIVGNG